MPIEATGTTLEIVTNSGVILVGLVRFGVWLARNRRNRIRRIVREELMEMQREALRLR